MTARRTGGRSWDLVTDTHVVGGPDRAIEVRLDFEVVVTVPAGGRTGDGWTCSAGVAEGPVEIGGDTGYTVLGPLTPVLCAFDYTGAQPAALTLRLTRPHLGGSAPPSGTATLRSGEDVESREFCG